jgi:hypothetical protein
VNKPGKHNPKALSEMLCMGLDEGKPADAPADEALRDLLRARLDGPALLTETAPRQRPSETVLGAFAVWRDARAADEMTLRRALTDASVPVSLLRYIATAAKQTAAGQRDSDVGAVERAVYFAALAAAVLHHRALVSQLSPAKLGESLVSLARRPWMVPWLGELLLEAAARCAELE